MTEHEILAIDALANLTYEEMMGFAASLQDVIEERTSVLPDVSARDIAESIQAVIDGWRRSHADDQRVA